MPGTRIPDTLVSSYRKARYVVFADNGPVMRIGEPCPALDELLDGEDAVTAAFVTAFNPHGLRSAEDSNWEAFVRLMQFAESAGYGKKCYLGEGNDPEGEWPPEPSLLLVGLTRAQAEEVGREFSQRAIVFVEKGRAPELVLLA